MTRLIHVLPSTLVLALAGACTDDGATGGAGGGGGPTGEAGGDAVGGAGGDAAHGGAGHGGSASTAMGGMAEGGQGGQGVGGEGGAGPSCLQAREDALGPIDLLSTGQVEVLASEGGVTTLFVDASAGGVQNQANNPWIYVDLEALVRVDVTDLAADGSQAWDLALKRPLLRTNSGDGGYAGVGGAIRLDKEFDDVTADDAGVPLPVEAWFDAECNLHTDSTGAIATTFDGWYSYENMTVLPGGGTWLIRAGDGASIFKLEFLDYYSNPDGTTGMAGGRYRVRVADLTP